MSLQDFALGTRTGTRPFHHEEDLAGRRVRQVLRITRDLRELFSGSSGILDIAAGGGEAVSWYRSLFPGVRLVCLESPTAKQRPTLARFAALAETVAPERIAKAPVRRGRPPEGAATKVSTTIRRWSPITRAPTSRCTGARTPTGCATSPTTSARRCSSSTAPATPFATTGWGSGSPS